MKKTNLIPCLFLLIIGFTSCTDYIRNEDQTTAANRWKAIFKIQEKEIPIIFHLDTVPLNIHGFRVRFIDGPGENQKEIVQLVDDSITVKLDYLSTLHLKGVLKNGQMEGVFHSQKKKNATPQMIPFTAYPSGEARFPSVGSPSTNDPTGDWEFVFKADSLSPNLGLYSTLHQLQLYKTDTTVVASGIYHQGFEGVLTENGFLLSSFSRDQPVLYEATFITPNEVEGTLYTYQETTSFRGRKKSNLESTTEKSSNRLIALWRLIEAYITYPK